MSRRSDAAQAAADASPYEMRFPTANPTTVRWQPASHREVRYWLDGYTYTAASAILAMERGEEVDMIWCRVRRRSK